MSRVLCVNGTGSGWIRLPWSVDLKRTDRSRFAYPATHIGVWDYTFFLKVWFFWLARRQRARGRSRSSREHQKKRIYFAVKMLESPKVLVFGWFGFWTLYDE